MAAITNDWLAPLEPEFKKPYYAKLYQTIREEYGSRKIFPSADDIFNAFDFTPYGQVKVVILGQDPYHEPNQAHGLCFSVKKGVTIPPSLVNIYKEISDDLGIKEPDCGDLTKWAKEGVLLLNTTLTVREHQANSHSKCGWAWFTDSVIKLISENTENTVFILWGGNARSKVPLIDGAKHYILQCAHPSPLSAYNGFFGCRHFSKANAYLISHGKQPIDWDLN